VAVEKKCVLVTGSDGFIGKNLCVALDRIENVELFTYDINMDERYLVYSIKQADIVFQLAGISRPEDAREFSGNIASAERVVSLLQQHNRRVPLVFSSSIQAGLDNAYGMSKQAAERVLIEFSRKQGSPLYIYRLSNVFGKWSKPNYNSVVATFCYNIARGKKINVVDSDKTINFVYIDDVVNEFVNLAMRDRHGDNDIFHSISKTYSITIGELAATLHRFREDSLSRVVPDLLDPITHYLYATYLSYCPEEELIETPDLKEDSRGMLLEFVKSLNAGQVFVSKTRRGVTRGNHYHDTKVEKICVIQGRACIELRSLQNDHKLVYELSGDDVKFLNIPPGFVHVITNTGDEELIALFWASEIFKAEKPDTHNEQS
jgi:UDP-2-acetamido-2,6-beta-L-arabino-hexul-4-ose reductase